MTSSQYQGHISVIGTSYLQPITTLIEALQSHEPKGSNDIQTSPYENGYSVAIISLTVFMIESIVVRIKKLTNNHTRNPLDFILNLINQDSPNLDFYHKIKELFVVRDVIAHNHVWEAQFTNNSRGDMELVDNPILQDGYGDKKYKDVLDISRQQTKLLKINIYPTRIGYLDALVVLNIAVDFLSFIENIDREYIYLSNKSVTYKDQRILFVDLIKNL